MASSEGHWVQPIITQARPVRMISNIGPSVASDWPTNPLLIQEPSEEPRESSFTFPLLLLA